MYFLVRVRFSLLGYRLICPLLTPRFTVLVPFQLWTGLGVALALRGRSLLLSQHALVRAIQLAADAAGCAGSWSNYAALLLDLGNPMLARAALVTSQSLNPALPFIWAGYV
jgi:hypothetical protein